MIHKRSLKEKTIDYLLYIATFSGINFIAGSVVQQLYREMLSVADEHGGKLPNRVMMFLDEIGTIPKIESAEMMFSASRSRRVSIVAIIQSFAQLGKIYGREGSAIIIDNCQDTVFGGFALNSEFAQILSKAMGSKTVMSGSVNRGKNDPSQSLQMIERPLMRSHTPPENSGRPKRYHRRADCGARQSEGPIGER